MTDTAVQLEPEKIPCARHPQEETRLRCTECGAPVCPKCMVMYEVGFKCPGCAKKRPSHSEQVSGAHAAIAIGLSLLAGFVYGWLHPLLMGLGVIQFFGIPILAFLLAYGLGMAAGNLIQRLIRFKIQRWLSWSVLLASLIGTFFSPFLLNLLEFATFALSSQNALNAGTSSSLYVFTHGVKLLGAFIFARGLARPFTR